MIDPSKSMRFLSLFIMYGIVLVLCGCATWHQRTIQYANALNAREYSEAKKLLQNDKNLKQNKNQILYYLNLGYVEFMLDKQAESNIAFSTAEQLIEQQLRQPLSEVAALITNPEVKPYRPEDFEIIMINVYKALNYLKLNDLEGALVEARRINIRLKQLNDKFPDHKSRYQQDAFAHLLMGWIYDASNDYNNAFIAYRNAFNIYESDYKRFFNITAPQQLKIDLVRTARLSGLIQESEEYATRFKLLTQNIQPLESNILFLWMNGLAPYKSEWGVNFILDTQKNGVVVFNNQELGLSFPFYLPIGNSDNSLANVEAIRVAFPKYVERKPICSDAVIAYNKQRYPLEIVEDINAIAFKSLHDRMIREFATSLLRVATKQGIKQVATQQNDWLGFAVGLANAMTEKADTRNWQTLPHSISFCRIHTNSATQMLQFIPFNNAQPQTISIPYRSQETRFEVYTTL